MHPLCLLKHVFLNEVLNLCRWSLLYYLAIVQNIVNQLLRHVGLLPDIVAGHPTAMNRVFVNNHKVFWVNSRAEPPMNTQASFYKKAAIKLQT